MILKSKVKPQFFPDQGQTTVLKMGLQPMPLSQWILVDEDLPQFLDHKLEQRVLHKAMVYQALPESTRAQAEFHKVLRQHLVQNNNYRLNDIHGLANRKHSLTWDDRIKDLWHCSLWIQEDICLLENIGKEYVLTAASVCSPSNWNMPSKVGQSVEMLHAPVPGYKKEMSDRVNKLLLGLKPNKPLQRLNWSIQMGGELFWRSDVSNHEDNVEKYWRVERQTLIRLPDTKAIVFGIRVFLHSFSEMSRYPNFNQSIFEIIEALPHAEAKYKNLRQTN
jgi:hypothetical protein